MVDAINVDDDGGEQPAPATTSRAAAGVGGATGAAQQTAAGGDAAQGSDTTDCMICLDALAESGNHRAVCLACGHIFGQACVLKWLAQNKSCPHCKKRQVQKVPMPHVVHASWHGSHARPSLTEY